VEVLGAVVVQAKYLTKTVGNQAQELAVCPNILAPASSLNSSNDKADLSALCRYSGIISSARIITSDRLPPIISFS